MDVRRLVYEGKIDDLFAAQTFCWWLADQKIEEPTKVVFTSGDKPYLYFFDNAVKRNLWVAGFEAILNIRINPIENL